MSKQEARLRKKIAAKDSALAKRLFDGVDAKYSQLQHAPTSVSKYASVYSPGLDSLNTSLQFLKTNNIGNVANNPELQKTLASYVKRQERPPVSHVAKITTDLGFWQYSENLVTTGLAGNSPRSRQV
jgi:GH25 family lysozyme M1 (1,4-beta-N-acetylmuramidase)